MAIETLMSLRQLALELGVPYVHIWQSARTMDLIDCRPAGGTFVVVTDDEEMDVLRKAADIRNRYGIAFPLALKLARDGWSEPERDDNPGGEMPTGTIDPR
jgi:hypothetical protein